jgi:hypothetical protein
MENNEEKPKKKSWWKKALLYAGLVAGAIVVDRYAQKNGGYKTVAKDLAGKLKPSKKEDSVCSECDTTEFVVVETKAPANFEQRREFNNNNRPNNGGYRDNNKQFNNKH